MAKKKDEYNYFDEYIKGAEIVVESSKLLKGALENYDLKTVENEISKEIGVNKHTYYKIESGVRKPTYEFMRKFKRRFGVSIDEMFF